MLFISQKVWSHDSLTADETLAGLHSNQWYNSSYKLNSISRQLAHTNSANGFNWFEGIKPTKKGNKLDQLVQDWKTDGSWKRQQKCVHWWKNAKIIILKARKYMYLAYLLYKTYRGSYYEPKSLMPELEQLRNLTQRQKRTLTLAAIYANHKFIALGQLIRSTSWKWWRMTAACRLSTYTPDITTISANSALFSRPNNKTMLPRSVPQKRWSKFLK
jgi:hypothetical protein